MAADRKKPDAKGGPGKTSAKPGSGGGRKPVTIDLDAKDVTAPKAADSGKDAAANPSTGPSTGQSGGQKTDPSRPGASAAASGSGGSGASASGQKPDRTSDTKTDPKSDTTSGPASGAKPETKSGAGPATTPGGGTATSSASSSTPSGGPKTTAGSAGSGPAGAASATGTPGGGTAGKTGASAGSGQQGAGGKPDVTAKPSDTKPADAKPSEAKTSGASVTGPKQTGASETRTPDPKMSDSKTSGPGTGGTAASGAASAASGAKPQKAASATAEKRSSSGAGIGGLLAASVLGAAVALGGVYGAHRAGYLPVETGADANVQAALTAAQSRVAGLEERVAGLAEAQESAAGDDGAVETLRAQISALEERVAALAAAPDAGDLPEDVAGRLDAVESGLGELRRFVSSGGAGETAGLASLEQSLAALSDRARDNAASVSALGERVDALSAELEADPGTDALAARVGKLETALAGAQDTASGLASLRETVDAVAQTVAAQGETAGQQATTLEAVRTDLGAMEERLGARLSDLSAQVSALDERLTPVEARIGDATARETAARALAVSRLKAALDRGAPFETELAAVAAALPQDADLGVLSERAGDGVPTQATLKARFGAVARAMSAALDRPADGDVVDSFWSNARSLVSIRQPGDTDADTPAAALGRMEARVEAGDFAGAVEAYETLPEAVRAAGADWVADARARVAADRLVDRVTADVLKSLGSTSN